MPTILGAGMTGLAVGIAGGWPIFEAVAEPGGICSSYYMPPGTGERLPYAPQSGDAYRFEIGGGHWIFGGDPAVLRYIRTLTPVEQYHRKSSVFFPQQGLYVPYPLQNHLGYLGKEVAVQALTEIAQTSGATPKTMADWLRQSFGNALTDLFFDPFHSLYTAGLWQQISPQDSYKSPVDFALALRGAFDDTPPVGYNTTFLYPAEGLGTLARCMAEQCDIRYNKKVVSVDTENRSLRCQDGTQVEYDVLVSTLPLNSMMKMSGLDVSMQPDPYTSVLVLNIGAVRGPMCPDDHWLYIPQSNSGFHRVGFYSNVNPSFLPRLSHDGKSRVSIYVERAYPGGQQPSHAEVESYCRSVVKELQEWAFIEDTEVVDPTWIDVAYTWSWPGSKWRAQALQTLEQHDVVMVGRYGRWVFQGIAESIAHGLLVGSSLAATSSTRPSGASKARPGGLSGE